MTEVEDVPVILLPCAVCGRTFRPEALSKHSAVCERQHTKKRKKFDSAKQRIQGTELAEFLGPPPLVNKPKPPSPKKVQSRWKEKHEALVKTIRAEQIKPLDHSQCPHCDRYFGPKAFDRHEAWCKEQHSKIHVQNQNQDVSKAKQRLHARTKYRAPSFKSQRTLTKEKYSPARPPVGHSTSSTFPSPAVEHHEPMLHRKASSVSATEVGVSGSGYGMVGRKSPGLNRQNSLSRTYKKTEEEPIRRPQDTAKKHDDHVNSSLPTLTRTSRAGSLSSQGSDSKSVPHSNHSGGASETGAMGSAATATPLLETKPTIKTSYSTNRKGKRDDSKSESKRWKRKPVASDQSANQTGVVPDFSMYNSEQSGETSGKSQQKVWSKLKSRNSIPLLIGSKSKKSKGKLKKSKVISPVKSSSSHKTITLSDREYELDNLKELNRRCENNGSFDCNDNTTSPNMSPCFDVTSDFEPTQTLLNNSSDNLDVIPENTNDNNSLTIEDFDKIPVDSTFIIEKSAIISDKITDSINPAPLLTDSNMINFCQIQNYENPVTVKPLSWVIPLSQSDDGETDLENLNVDELNTGETGKSRENLSQVIELQEERNVSNVDKNEFLIVNDVEIVDNLITETSPQDNDDKWAENSLNLDNEKGEEELIVMNRESRPSSRKSNTLKNKKKMENSSSSDIFTLGESKKKTTGKKKSSSMKSNYGCSSSENLPSLRFESTGFSRLSKIEEIPVIQPVTIEAVKKSRLKNEKKKIRKPFKCECHKIIDTIQCNLALLSECKCLNHSNRDDRSCEENPFKLSHLMKFSKHKYLQRKSSNLSCIGTLEKGNEIISYSDSEIYRLNEAFLDGFGRNQSKFSYLPCLKNKCYKDSASQTSSRIMLHGQSDSENGSISSSQNNQRGKMKSYQNGLELCSSKRDMDVGSTSRRVSNGLGMGERLRDVRRLLNRSIEAQSNDSFDYIEEDRSTLNGSLSERNPQFEIEEINSCVQYPEGQNNDVILTSVKRLLNPREKLNRRIALREWQVMQSGCSAAPNGTWQQFDELNHNWKMTGGGDGACGLTHPSVIHLPPLGNSTPKRLNRRWSPSGGEQITGSGASAQDDGALSKFCHECGGRYPVAGAKFCCLCGVRRLAI